MPKLTTFTEKKKIYSFVNAVSLLLLIAVISLTTLLIKGYSKEFSTNPERNYYTAVVVEVVPHVPSNNTLAKKLNNVNLYVDVIENCSLYSPDIIVFPECGLIGCPNITDRDIMIEDFATIIPSVESGINPCHTDNYSEVLSIVACAAENYNVYVVINLYEKVFCTGNDNYPCTKNEILLFNTNVAFDRTGKIIARYRKFNLYKERTYYGINTTREPELSTFTTDFGVTFGMIICFDILFKQPSTNLITEMNVTGIIFSGAVFSEFPFLAVTSLGAGWSYAMNTTLLLADMSTTFGGVGGSGIYIGRSDPLSVLMQEHNETRYLLSKVPIKSHIAGIFDFNHSFQKKISASNNISAHLDDSDQVEDITVNNFNHSKFLIDSTLNKFIIKTLNEGISNINILQSNNFTHKKENFTCHVNIVWFSNSSTNLSNYKLVAYSGNRNFSNASINNYIEICGLMLCTVDKNNTCILPPDLTRKPDFYIISISIFVTSNVTTSVVIPSTLDNYLHPLSVSHFTFDSYVQKIGDKLFRITIMNLIQPVPNLVTFATYSLPEESNPSPDIK